jgi:hypothetical protein
MTGPKVKRFEQEFASFVGSTVALALNSGTGALHVALATLGKTVHRPKSSKGTTMMRRLLMEFCGVASMSSHLPLR